MTLLYLSACHILPCIAHGVGGRRQRAAGGFEEARGRCVGVDARVTPPGLLAHQRVGHERADEGEREGEGGAAGRLRIRRQQGERGV